MRLNLRLKGTAESLILNLTEVLDVMPKEVVLDALAAYNLAVAEIRDRKRLGVYDPESEQFTAIATPTLQALAAKVARGEVEEVSNEKSNSKFIATG